MPYAPLLPPTTPSVFHITTSTRQDSSKCRLTDSINAPCCEPPSCGKRSGLETLSSAAPHPNRRFSHVCCCSAEMAASTLLTPMHQLRHSSPFRNPQTLIACPRPSEHHEHYVLNIAHISYI